MGIRSFPHVVAAVLTALAFPTLALANPSPETPQAATAAELAANSWETDTSPVTLSVYVDSPTQLRLTTFWGIDPVSVRWQEDTGIDLEWVIAPDDSQAKLNVLMASGDLPDLIHLSQELPQIRQLADNGLVWNVRELSESHAPGVWDYLWNRNKHVIVHFRTLFDSMDIFMVPFQHLPQDYVDSPYAIRAYQGTTAQDVILDNAGNPKVASTADYVDLLRAVKAAHPELIPLQSSRNASPSRDGDPQLVQAALPIAGLSQRYFDIDGTWVKYWEHPTFVALLRFANTLYRDGLLDPTEFTDSKSALKAKGFRGQVFSELSQDADNMPRWTTKMQEVHPDRSYVMLPHFTVDPATMRYTTDALGGGTGGSGMMVSTSSKHPDRAIRFIDYLYQDDIQRMIAFGIEGHGHTMEDGIPRYTQPAQESIDAATNAPDFGIFAYNIWRDAYWSGVRTFTNASPDLRAILAMTNATYDDLSFYRGAENFPSNSEEVKAFSVIKDFYATEIMEVITGPPDRVEPRYASMIESMHDLGLGVLNAYWTELFSGKLAVQEQYSADF